MATSNGSPRRSEMDDDDQLRFVTDHDVKTSFWQGCSTCGILGAALGAALGGAIMLIALYYIGSTSGF